MASYVFIPYLNYETARIYSKKGRYARAGASAGIAIVSGQLLQERRLRLCDLFVVEPSFIAPDAELCRLLPTIAD
jgi:hypothetical protein